MTSKSSLEKKFNSSDNQGCLSCFIYPAASVFIISFIWSCGYLSGKLVNQPSLQEENIIGGEKLERFYEIKGDRAYLDVDEKPIEDYFKKY